MDLFKRIGGKSQVSKGAKNGSDPSTLMLREKEAQIASLQDQIKHQNTYIEQLVSENEHLQQRVSDLKTSLDTSKQLFEVYSHKQSPRAETRGDDFYQDTTIKVVQEFGGIEESQKMLFEKIKSIEHELKSLNVQLETNTLQKPQSSKKVNVTKLNLSNFIQNESTKIGSTLKSQRGTLVEMGGKKPVDLNRTQPHKLNGLWGGVLRQTDLKIQTLMQVVLSSCLQGKNNTVAEAIARMQAQLQAFLDETASEQDQMLVFQDQRGTIWELVRRADIDSNQIQFLSPTKNPLSEGKESSGSIDDSRSGKNQPVDAYTETESEDEDLGATYVLEKFLEKNKKKIAYTASKTEVKKIDMLNHSRYIDREILDLQNQMNQVSYENQDADPVTHEEE